MALTVEPPLRTAELVTLDCGAAIHVRPITPNDAAALVAFHSRLSDRSKFLRYFYPHTDLSADEVAHLTQLDGRDRVALVAEFDGDLIAVGRYERLDDPTVAEVAFVVADRFQHQGIAPMLLSRLAGRAQSVGVTHFTAEVLDENRAMLHVFHESGFTLKRKNGWDTVELQMAITPAATRTQVSQSGTHQSS
jgi:RimJ/RimL family protein N-acetyltransferase